MILHDCVFRADEGVMRFHPVKVTGAEVPQAAESPAGDRKAVEDGIHGPAGAGKTAPPAAYGDQEGNGE